MTLTSTPRPRQRQKSHGMIVFDCVFILNGVAPTTSASTGEAADPPALQSHRQLLHNAAAVPHLSQLRP
jgi:hypothetical protein